MMNIAITAAGDNLQSPLDSRFGRALKFVIIDSETSAVTAVDNRQNLNSPQGAGIQAAMTVVQAGASVLITGHCGPKAFKVLQSAGIKIYQTDAPTVAEALEHFRAGQLVEAQNSDVEGHWV